MESFLYDILKSSAKIATEEALDMDWNELPLVLSTNELLLNGPLEDSVNLSPVRTEGPYLSIDEYMDTYFRLLRADCFDAIRVGIDDLKKNKLDPRDMNVYHKITIPGILPSNFEAGIQLALRVTPCQPVENWSTSSKLMFGNLLCLTPSGTFKDAIWATIANREEELLKQKDGPVIVVELCSASNSSSEAECLTALIKANGSILMVESPTYYRAHQPVLKALQKIQPEDLPFEEEFVSVDGKSHLPKYIGSYSYIDGSIIYKSLPTYCPMSTFLKHKATSKDDTPLDSSQEKAIKRALKQRVALIQGPPGCGKTFIGIQLVQLLFSITTLPSSPILVLTYKNHALDEFLKEMVKLYPDDVVRVGGRSKEPTLEACNLNEIKKQSKSDTLASQIGELMAKQRNLKPLLIDALQELANARHFSVKSIMEYFDDGKIEKLLVGCDWSRVRILSGTGKWVDKSYICSLIQKMKNHIKETMDSYSDYYDEELAKEMQPLIKRAVEEWSPSMDFFNQIDKVATNMFQPT